MAGTTTNYSIPYPENTDPVDVAGDIQDLATSIDTSLHEKVAVSGDILTGNLTTSYEIPLDNKGIRNITVSSVDPSEGINGDVWLRYVP